MVVDVYADAIRDLCEKAQKDGVIIMVKHEPLLPLAMGNYKVVGSAIANEQVVLSSPVTERIVTLNYSDGGYIRRGEVIASLAQSQEVAELAGAQARARENFDSGKSAGEAHRDMRNFERGEPVTVVK